MGNALEAFLRYSLSCEKNLLENQNLMIMTRYRSSGRNGKEKFFGRSSAYTQSLNPQKEGRKGKQEVEKKWLCLEKEICNGMLYCQSKMKPTCCCCIPGLIITPNLELQKSKDFFPVALGPDLPEVQIHVANAQKLKYILDFLIFYILFLLHHEKNYYNCKTITLDKIWSNKRQ